MDSLGGYFREEREAQGLTFEQLAVSTKIKGPYLEALEEERFNLLPEKVFTKGFVRNYARVLGLDEEEALRRFSASAQSYYQKEEEQQQQVIQREEAYRKGKADRNAVSIFTGVILIGLVFVFIFSYKQSVDPTLQTGSTLKSIPPTAEIKTEGEPGQDVEGDGQASVASSTSDTEETSIQVAVVPKSKVIPPRPVQPVVKPKPVIQEAVVPPPVESTRSTRVPFKSGSGEQDGPIMLELEALEITWVVVRSDDRAPHEALLRPGERALWRAHERFLLTLGNAGGVRVTLNGEPRGPFGEQGMVVRELEIKP